MRFKFVTLLVYLFACSTSSAESIIFSNSNSKANFSVSVKEDAFSELKALETDNTNFVYEYDPETLFNNKAYRQVTFVLRWEPSDENIPAPNVSEMTVEFPVLLRAWKPRDLLIKSDYFLGVDERSISSYEKMTALSQQTERYFGSLLARKHYHLSENRPTFGRVRRSAKAALDAARIISNSDSGDWFVPTMELAHFVNQSWKGLDEMKILENELSALRARPFKDTQAVETLTPFLNLSCDQKKSFFNYLHKLLENDISAAKRAFPDGNGQSIIDEKRKLILNGNCD